MINSFVSICVCRRVRWAHQIRCVVLSLFVRDQLVPVRRPSILVTLWEIVPTVILHCRLLLKTQLVSVCVRRRQVLRWWYCLFGRVKICCCEWNSGSLFLWLSSLISCGHNFSLFFFGRYGPFYHHLIVPSVYLFVFHRYPECVSVSILCCARIHASCYSSCIGCAFEVWRRRDHSTTGPWQRRSFVVCSRSCC